MSEQRVARGLLGAAAIVVATLVLSSCAQIPTSGPVKSGGDPRLAQADNRVRSIGRPPRPGDSQTGVVEGFLASSADFRNDHAVAREYLTPTAAQSWRPQTSTVVYEPTASPPIVVDSDDLSVEYGEKGQINEDGSFTSVTPDTTVTRSFHLTKVDGEWRISALQNGLLLSSSDVDDAYHRVALYFVAPSGTTVVPDLVFLPELPGLTTKVVARLLRGPAADLQGAVTTAFPDGTALDVNAVSVSNGLATVQLSSTARQANDEARVQMSAQIVYTLKQFPDITRVRIKAGGQDLGVTGGVEQSVTLWPLFDPDYLTTNEPSAYYSHGGAIGTFGKNGFNAVRGSGGRGVPPLQTPAVSLDLQRLAAVGNHGRTVYVGPMAVNATMRPRISGKDLSQPSWDRGQNLWVVNRATGELWYLADGAQDAQVVALPRDPTGLSLTGVSVGRDGARVALIFGTGRDAILKVAAIQRIETVDGSERVGIIDMHEPRPDLRGVRNATWADATTIAVLGSVAGSGSGPFVLDPQGYRIDDIQPLPDAITLTAAPPYAAKGPPLVAGTSSGTLYEYTSAGGWTQAGAGWSPAYPG
jgi:lipoprotein LpqB-like beta-propeller protein/sporulation and spore germination protein